MARVRIFIDHDNFDVSWQRYVGGGVDWKKFSRVVIERLAYSQFVDPSRVELKGILVYASLHPRPREQEVKFEHWLRYRLGQQPGYTVKLSTRHIIKQQCDQGHSNTFYSSKGVDTKITCDMLSLAMRDTYDLGILLSDDSDLIPAVEFVQDALDRRIVHLGFEKSGQNVRCATWGHVLLDDIAPELTLPTKSAAPASAPKRT
jgi:uncharacterized LabA/DUF88 family protein